MRRPKGQGSRLGSIPRGHRSTDRAWAAGTGNRSATRPDVLGEEARGKGYGPRASIC